MYSICTVLKRRDFWAMMCMTHTIDTHNIRHMYLCIYTWYVCAYYTSILYVYICNTYYRFTRYTCVEFFETNTLKHFDLNKSIHKIQNASMWCFVNTANVSWILRMFRRVYILIPYLLLSTNIQCMSTSRYKKYTVHVYICMFFFFETARVGCKVKKKRSEQVNK